MRPSILLIAILLFSLAASAQQATDANIVGDVKEAQSGKHIPFINVTVNNTVLGTTTDATGHYFLKNLPAGKHTIRVSGLGYRSVEQEVLIEVGKTLEVNFVTEESALSLNELVVSANRNETNRKDASVVVGIVNPKLFAATNSVSLADGLNFQPGLRVENNCNNCGFSQVRINGLEGPYSQILIDSRPIFSSLSGVYGLEQIPVNMIERVEIVRGGGSALYGSNAIAGTINIITKEALSNSFSAGYNQEWVGGLTPDHSINLSTSIITDDNKAGMYLYGAHRNRLPYDHNGDGFSELTKLINHTVGMRSYYRLSSQSKLTLEYHNINEFRRGGNDFDLQPHEADITEQLEHETNGGGLAYNWYSPDSKQKLNVYSSVQHVFRKSYYGTGKDLNAYGRTNNLTAIMGAQYVRNFEDLLFMPAELTFGGEYQYDDLQDRMPGYNRNIEQTTGVAGFFLQNEWKNNRMNILLGGRLDKHTMLENFVFSPRITLKYNFTPDLNWHGSYSAGFRAPQAFDEDLHLDAAGGVMKLIVLDENLRPEYSNSYSTSIDYYFQLGRVEANLLVEGFYTDIRDIFILTETGMDTNGNIIMTRQNGSGAKVRGLNLEAKVAPTTYLQLQFGVTVQKSTYNQAERWSDDALVSAERRLLRTPGNYGYFTLSYAPLPALQLSATGTYTGSMLAPHFAGFIANDRLETTPSFLDAGLKAAYDIKLQGVGLQLTGGVKNMFNSYQSDHDIGPLRDAGYVYGPSQPRTFFVGVKFSNILN